MLQPHYLSLFLGQGRGSLLPSSLKALKYSKCAPLSDLSINPVTHLFQHTQCICGALQNCPLFLHWIHVFSHFFPWILSFSSNRKVQNSAPSFHFATPGREFTQKSTQSTKFQHFQLLKEMKFRPHQIIYKQKPVYWQNQCRMMWISTHSSTCTQWSYWKAPKSAPLGKYISRILHHLYQKHLLSRP